MLPMGVPLLYLTKPEGGGIPMVLVLTRWMAPARNKIYEFFPKKLHIHFETEVVDGVEYQLF